LLGIAEIHEEIAKSDENLAEWEERPREPRVPSLLQAR